MAFIKTIQPSESEGEVRAMFERQQKSWGFVPNYAKVFCHRPEVMARWARLLAEIRRPMDDRRFELATFAAAHELKNTACTLEHGKQLGRIIGPEAVVSLGRGETSPELSEAELAIAAFARKIANDASAITAEDVEGLKAHGLGDAEIFDIAAAAAGLAFFT
ncbi:MAG: peroxidase [Gammaproteobacteria bacterium]|nr:MAG: peroxidase [Gammaproteobacteria bacterium]